MLISKQVTEEEKSFISSIQILRKNTNVYNIIFITLKYFCKFIVECPFGIIFEVSYLILLFEILINFKWNYSWCVGHRTSYIHITYIHVHTSSCLIDSIKHDEANIIVASKCILNVCLINLYDSMYYDVCSARSIHFVFEPNVPDISIAAYHFYTYLYNIRVKSSHHFEHHKFP